MSKMSDLAIAQQEAASHAYDAGYKQCVEDFKLGQVYDIDNEQTMSPATCRAILDSCGKALADKPAGIV